MDGGISKAEKALPEEDEADQQPDDVRHAQTEEIKRVMGEEFNKLAKNVQNNTLDVFRNMRAHSEMQPFVFKNEMAGETFFIHEGGVPALFVFKSLKHTNINAGTSDTPIKMHTLLHELRSSNKQINDSVSLLEGQVSTLTYEYSPVNYADAITNPRFSVNYLTSGVTIDNLAKSVYFQASDAINCALYLLRYGRIIMIQPRKESLFGAVDISDDFVEAIELFKGDNAHPYLYGVYPDKRWLATELAGAAAIARLSIGERDVHHVGNIKHHSKIRCVTDQYTAAIMKQVFEERVLSARMTEEEYRNILLAMEFNGSQVNFDMFDSAQLYMYKPPESILRLITVLLIAHPNLWKMYGAIHESMLQTSNLFLVASQQTMYDRILGRMGSVDANVFSTFTSLMPIVDEKILHSYLVRECFAHQFKVTWITQTEPVNFIEGFLLVILHIYDRLGSPNLVMHGLDTFGYNFMKAVKMMLPTAFASMVNLYGFTREGNAIRSKVPEKLTYENCLADKYYTLFDPNIVINNPLLEEIRRIMTNQTPSVTQYIMNRKRAANMPYAADDYSTFRTYDIDLNNDELHNSNAKQMVYSITDLAFRLWNEATSTNKVTMKQSSAYMITILNYIQNEMETIGPVLHAFETTQDHIRQGPGYVVCPIENANSQFIPRRNVLCSAPLPGYTIDGASQVGGGHTLVCQTGTWLSIFLLTSAQFDRQAGRPNQSPVTRVIAFPDGRTLFDMYKQSIDIALRYADGISFYRTVLENVNRPHQADPLIAAAMTAFKAYSAEEIMRMIDTTLQIELSALFTLPGSGLFRDVRNVHMALRKLDIGGRGIVAIPGTVFADNDVNGAIPARVTLMQMLLSLYLSQDTYFRPSGVGIVLSRVQVLDGVHPAQPFPRNLHRVPYDPRMFTQFTTAHVRIACLNFTDAQGGRQQVTDPLDPRLDGVLITVGAFGNIQPEHRDWFFQSITAGRLSVEATTQMFEYSYVMLNDPLAYSLAMDTDCVRDVLGSERASIPRIWAIDNRQNICATTFGRIPPVTISVWSLESLREPVLMSGMYNSVDVPPVYVGNRRNVAAICGYGTNNNGVNLMPLSRTPKLDSLPNANNEIPVMTNKMYLEPAFNITRIPPATY